MNRLGPGEPIDRNLINSMIDRLNELEDADKIRAYSSNGRAYSTVDDNMLVQGFRKYVSISKQGSGYYGTIGNMTFPKPFADVPIVTVTFDSGGSYLSPYVHSVTTAGFQLSVVRISDSFADLPPKAYANVIAIGPVAAS